MKRILIVLMTALVLAACGSSSGGDSSKGGGTPLNENDPLTWHGLYNIDYFMVQRGSQYISSESIDYFKGQAALKSNSMTIERLIVKMQIEDNGIKELVYTDSDGTDNDPYFLCEDPDFTFDGSYELSFSMRCYDSQEGQYYNSTFEVTKVSDNFEVLPNTYYR